MTCSWDDLAGLTLARQFPGEGAEDGSRTDPAALVGLVGPMQTQTARSAFVGLAARAPGISGEAISAAYTAGALVRGSTIRGTVHTATPSQFTTLALATRLGQRRRWTRALKLPDDLVDELWAATEEFADEWRMPAELQEHLVDWLAEHGCHESARLAAQRQGRYLAFGQGGLVRRPADGADWSGQGAPLYRRFGARGTPSLLDVVRLHLRSHGPASRQDLAWWSGLTLGAVDAAVDELAGVSCTGPDGRTYLDLADRPPPRDLPGVRLLPEFDALLCGYDPKARERFIEPRHHSALWNRGNGLMRAPLLVDGRVTGHWRASGTASKRPLEVHLFPGTRRPRASELDAPVAALEAALDITVSSLTVSRSA